MKSIFRYPGSKWTIAPWIIEHFPCGYEKMVYLEPFAGSLAVFFNKLPGKIEVVNDLDGDIVNFFRVLRERPDDLLQAIALTPYSREEYDKEFAPAFQCGNESDVLREHLDRQLREVAGDDLPPFTVRYPYIKMHTYKSKKGQNR